eukprot:TRINITY_DN5876_c0_g1_i2.p2 TRINITY_DN5876_c0_g1~~TRINITY_DN5876_c0_g1_i2.p2  ORF type:complete len:478 (-),score=188.04 TRINITY_DN5876_c0_g1_i2:196-1629(-)
MEKAMLILRSLSEKVISLQILLSGCIMMAMSCSGSLLLNQAPNTAALLSADTNLYFPLNLSKADNMDKFNGKYRFVSADNKAAVFGAWFNNKLPEQDMAIMMHPDNKICNEITFSDKDLKMSIAFSMKSDFNESMVFPLGVEKKVGAPYNCASTVTVCGDNCVKEVTTYEDGAVYSSTANYSSQGYTVAISSASGFIGTAYFERVDACLAGFYVMESHDNLDKMMMEDAGISASAAADMIQAGIALRISESNGVYTMTDYLGTSGSKTINFQIGVESEFTDPTFKMSGTQLVTKTGPGSYTMVYKDSSGKTSVWEGTLSETHFTFKTTKPLNTQCGSIVYKRLADICGQFKVVAVSNLEAGLKEHQVPQQMIDALVAERAVHTVKYLGGGRFEWTTGSQAFPTPPVVFKSGEEFSYSTGGYTVSEVLVHTASGFSGASKTNGVTTVMENKVGKNFGVIESMIEGKPHTKSTVIMMRI